MSDLMARYGPDLEDAARYAANKVRPWQGRLEADDVMQELVVQLLRRGIDADVLEQKGGRPYLFTAAKNIALNMQRARRNDYPVGLQPALEPSQGAALLRTVPAAGLGPLDVLVASEAAQTVRKHVDRVLSRLEGKAAKVCALFYLDGLTQDQIAERLGLASGTVAWHMNQAKGTLGAAWDDLRIWRAYAYPEAPSTKGTPQASAELRALLV